MLKYKTNPGSGPQGKPRVYFCCHPKDFDLYFEPVSNEILAIQDCAIWYPEDLHIKRDEAFLSELKQMQLFLLPVTTNLLCTENPALDREFAFAISNHIPVLPLMQESNLEDLFNQKCGNLQFLDKNSFDKLAISYDEKLKKYLSSVLIGDDLVKRISASFVAYIFLSYRKKDRKFAQELMRLIHRNPFCRDIAIWYDEFLTPGEDFNVSIQSALKKSDLFLLAVTPNLVNETNYVMTDEYPVARDSKKPILPAEMVQTERSILFEKYKGLPAPVDARNAAALEDALSQSLRAFSQQKENEAPEHTFLIGLAYLGGVDVEVDTERALSLIISAAQQDYPEAIEKLSNMYHVGEAVAKDLTAAINWQKKLVRLRENDFYRTGTPQAATDWLNAQETLATLFFEAEDYASATEVLKALVPLCKKLYRPTVFTKCGRLLLRHTRRFPPAYLMKPKALLLMGHCLLLQGEIDDAEDAFDDAEDAFWDYETDETPSLESIAGQAEATLGMTQIDLQAAAKNARFREEYRDILQTDNRSQLSEYTHTRYQRAAQMLEEARKTYCDAPVLLQLLFECYCQWGQLYVVQQRFPEAEERYCLALTVLQQLPQQGNSQFSLDFAHIQLLLGELIVAQIKGDDKAHSFERCLQTYEKKGKATTYFQDALQLLEAPDAVISVTSIVLTIRCYAGLGDLSGLVEVTEKTAEMYEKACDLEVKYPSITSTYECQQLLQQCRRKLDQYYAE